jgi:hypothetical protein
VDWTNSLCIIAGHSATIQREGGSTTLDWGQVFHGDSDLAIIYVVTVGSRDGLSDLVREKRTTHTRYNLDIRPDAVGRFVAIRAVFETGQFTIYTDFLTF